MDENESLPGNTDWKFVGLFGLYLGLFVGLAQILRLQFDILSRMTAWAVARFWSLLQVPAFHTGTYVTFYDFTMEIIFECTGIHYIGIFTAGVLAYSGHSRYRKIQGLFAGFLLILLLNVLRLGLLGMVGHFFVDFFSFLHLYLWHALFTLFVLLLWLLWVKGSVRISGLRTKQLRVATIVALLAFWFLWANMSLYFAFLAGIADILFPLLGGVMRMPSSVIQDRGLIGYITGTHVIYSKTGLYTLNLAVFIALTAAGAVSSSLRLWIKRTGIGSMLIILLHLILLLLDWTLEVAVNALARSLLIWTMVLSSMIAPVLAWLCAVLVFKTESVPINGPNHPGREQGTGTP